MELNQIPQNPNNWGNVADILNENSGKIEAETAKLSNATTKFKGYFSTSTALSAKWPSPLVGDTAWVGATYPGVVYRCDVAGTWLATTDVPPSNTVNLSEYATQDAVSNEFASVRSDLNERVEKTAIKQITGSSETDIMSQKSVTDELNALETNLNHIVGDSVTILGNTTSITTQLYLSAGRTYKLNITLSATVSIQLGGVMWVSSSGVYDYTPTQTGFLTIYRSTSSPVDITIGYTGDVTGRLNQLEIKQEGLTSYDRHIFGIKDCMAYKSLSRISNLHCHLVSGENRITNLSLIQQYISNGQVFIIFNINGRNNGVNFSQDVTFIQPIGSNSDIIANTYIDKRHYRFTISYDAIGYEAKENINLASISSYRLFVRDLDLVLRKIYVRFSTAELMNANPSSLTDPSMAFYAELGGVKYKRLETNLLTWVQESRNEFSQFKLIKSAERSSKLFLGINNAGKFCFMNGPLTKIEYCDTFDDLVYKTLYDLRAMNSNFTTMRHAWFLQNGNVLVFENCDSSTDYIGGLWLIDTTANTFTKTLTFGSSKVLFLHRGSIAFNGNVIYYGEYGTWGYATKLWYSTNNGLTWQMMYDFANAPNVVSNGIHIHSVTWDSYWKRLWVATGDYANVDGRSSKRIYWTDNGGLSWGNKDLVKIFGETLSSYDCVQFLSGLAQENFLLWGGDDYNNCIYRSIRIDKNLDIDRVYFYDKTVTNKITQYTGEFKKLSNGLIIVPLLNGDAGSYPQRTRIMGTFDGVKWYELFSEVATDGIAPIANDGVIVERDGYLYYGSVTADIGTGRVQICKLIKFIIPLVV